MPVRVAVSIGFLSQSIRVDIVTHRQMALELECGGKARGVGELLRANMETACIVTPLANKWDTLRKSYGWIACFVAGKQLWGERIGGQAACGNHVSGELRYSVLVLFWGGF